MWTHEESIEVAATPAHIWSLFADVAGWPRWNAGIEQIEIHGAFAAGTTFTMKVPDAGVFTSRLLDVRADQSFVDETMIDDTRVVVRHELQPLQSGLTRVTYATEITGPSAEAFGPLVTGDFPEVLQALKQLAETAARSA